MPSPDRPRLVGINHVALEVGDVQKALDFYGAIFHFDLRGTSRDDGGRLTMAFLDMGDQFLALSEPRDQPPDNHRHFGLVVDDRSRVRALAQAAGADVPEGRSLRIRDPWGNQIEIVDYADLQFLKHDAVLARLGVSGRKSDAARKQLSDKGIHLPDAP